jgi:hypothetical protein
MSQTAAALGGSSTASSGDDILRPEHGFVLRSGLDSQAAVQALEARGCRAALHGAMIEMSILSFQEQNCKDLLKDMAVCFVDDEHHLQGAEQMVCAGCRLAPCCAEKTHSLENTFYREHLV